MKCSLSMPLPSPCPHHRYIRSQINVVLKSFTVNASASICLSPIWFDPKSILVNRGSASTYPPNLQLDHRVKPNSVKKCSLSTLPQNFRPFVTNITVIQPNSVKECSLSSPPPKPCPISTDITIIQINLSTKCSLSAPPSKPAPPWDRWYNCNSWLCKSKNRRSVSWHVGECHLCFLLLSIILLIFPSHRHISCTHQNKFVIYLTKS